jgi:hypothetical protein
MMMMMISPAPALYDDDDGSYMARGWLALNMMMMA